MQVIQNYAAIDLAGSSGPNDGDATPATAPGTSSLLCTATANWCSSLGAQAAPHAPMEPNCRPSAADSATTTATRSAMARPVSTAPRAPPTTSPMAISARPATPSSSERPSSRHVRSLPVTSSPRTMPALYYHGQSYAPSVSEPSRPGRAQRQPQPKHRAPGQSRSAERHAGRYSLQQQWLGCRAGANHPGRPMPIDAPSWAGGVPSAMSASDGMFDTTVENVRGNHQPRRCTMVATPSSSKVRMSMATGACSLRRLCGSPAASRPLRRRLPPPQPRRRRR